MADVLSRHQGSLLLWIPDRSLIDGLEVQQEFPELRKRYCGRHFWGRGYFSVTSGNVTDEMIEEYINNHVDAHKKDYAENISLE